MTPTTDIGRTGACSGFVPHALETRIEEYLDLPPWPPWDYCVQQDQAKPFRYWYDPLGRTHVAPNDTVPAGDKYGTTGIDPAGSRSVEAPLGHRGELEPRPPASVAARRLPLAKDYTNDPRFAGWKPNE